MPISGSSVSTALLFICLFSVETLAASNERVTCGARGSSAQNANFGNCNVTEFWVRHHSDVVSTLSSYAGATNALIIGCHLIDGREYQTALNAYGNRTATLFDEWITAFTLLSTELTAGAVPKAIKDFCTQTNIDLTFVIVYQNEQCDASRGVSNTMEAVAAGVDVVLGVPCGAVTIHTAEYLNHWNIPVVSIGSWADALRDKTKYGTLVRTSDGPHNLAAAFIEFMEHYKWSNISVMKGPGSACGLIITAIYTIINDNKDTSIVLAYEARQNNTDGKLIQDLNRIKDQSRIIILCFEIIDLRRILRLAEGQGMTSPEFVYLVPKCFTSMEYVEELWGPTDGMEQEDIDKLKALYTRLKVFTLPFPTEASQIDLMDSIAAKAEQAPFNLNYIQTLNIKNSPYALDYYDAVTMYLTIITEAIAQGVHYRNGTYIFNQFRNRTHNGVAGKVVMDDNGDRVSEFWVWQWDEQTEKFIHFADVLPVKDHRLNYTVNVQEYWGTDDGRPPLNVPKCGYDGSICSKRILVGALLGVLSVVVISALVSVVVLFLYRKRRYQQDVKLMTWKIDRKDLRGGSNTDGEISPLSMTDVRPNLWRRIQMDVPQAFTKVMVYRDKSYAVKRIQKKNLKLTRTELLELKIAKDLSHDNVNPFIGACLDHPYIYLLTEYCNKGSLEDILENNEIKLDLTFKYSLIFDIVNGLTYIHDSPAEAHGNLKSSNCLIDNRWTVKIAKSFLKHVRYTNIPDEMVGKHKNDRGKLWIAPELLRLDLEHPSLGATKKGDVFSFGIILQEILYRAPPYFLNDTPHDEVIKNVKEGQYPPYRPTLPEITNRELQTASKLMQDCWHEHPDARPDMYKIKKWTIQLFRKKKITPLEVIVQRLEKYTNNLEEIVENRDDETLEEKDKTDILLFSLLPFTIAESIKEGNPVEPQTYDCVTIYFSDVVKFSSIAAESTPRQVITLINDLYLVFDDIIFEFDVYKVDTVADAYMIVSGCPDTNGIKHATEIAKMALSLRHVSSSFKLAHLPDKKLLLRIGIHTGPCAAGVIGVAMPKFCLFGVTVNVASRMESTGEANKIHVTETCKELLVKISDQYIFTNSGEVEIPGKGTCKTYWLDMQKESLFSLLPTGNTS